MAISKPELGWRGFAKRLDPRFVDDSRVHTQDLLDLVEDRGTIGDSQHGLVLHACIAAGQLAIIEDSPEAIA